MLYIAGALQYRAVCPWCWGEGGVASAVKISIRSSMLPSPSPPNTAFRTSV